jgi:hypothetical protein
MSPLRVTVGLSILLAVVCPHKLELPQAPTPSQKRPLIRPLVKIPGQGGRNGTAFDDLADIEGETVSNIYSIEIGVSQLVESIQVTYLLSNGSLYKAPKHGKVHISSPQIITLNAGEYVERIKGKTDGEVIDQLTITTWSPNDGHMRVHGPFGKTNASYDIMFEGFMLGFHGESRRIVNNIGIYKLAPITKSDLFGITKFSGTFDDNPDYRFPPVVRITKLFVYHGGQVSAIQAEYLLFGGGTKLSDMHGTPANNLTVVRFKHDEEIAEIQGKLDHQKIFLNQFSIITKRRNGRRRVYGPFGRSGGKCFSVQGTAIGLAGSASNFVQGISFYYYT